LFIKKLFSDTCKVYRIHYGIRCTFTLRHETLLSKIMSTCIIQKFYFLTHILLSTENLSTNISLANKEKFFPRDIEFLKKLEDNCEF
jgi:hypothetical protein